MTLSSAYPPMATKSSPSKYVQDTGSLPWREPRWHEVNTTSAIRAPVVEAPRAPSSQTTCPQKVFQEIHVTEREGVSGKLPSVVSHVCLVQCALCFPPSLHATCICLLYTITVFLCFHLFEGFKQKERENGSTEL